MAPKPKPKEVVMAYVDRSPGKTPSVVALLCPQDGKGSPFLNKTKKDDHYLTTVRQDLWPVIEPIETHRVDHCRTACDRMIAGLDRVGVTGTDLIRALRDSTIPKPA